MTHLDATEKMTKQLSTPFMDSYFLLPLRPVLHVLHFVQGIIVVLLSIILGSSGTADS